MPRNNLLQAYRPETARFIEQQPGTAPGFVANLEVADPEGTLVEKVIYAVPGVPWEMKEMMQGTVLPDLKARSGATDVIVSRVLRTWGQSESGLAEMLADRIEELDELGNPTLAFLASGIEGLKVRVTAKAATEADAVAVLDEEEARLRRSLGELVFGVDDDTMESVVLAQLVERGLTLAVAESLTGGMVGSRLVDVPGASRAFVGGIVAYDSRVKFEVLGVPEGPVVTLEAAEAMATGVRERLGADVGLGITGVAGPDAAEDRPPGTVCIALDVQGDVSSTELRLPGRRQQVREFSCITALGMLRRRLAGEPTS